MDKFQELRINSDNNPFRHYPILLFVAITKQYNQSQLGKKGYIFGLQGLLSPLWRDAKAGPWKGDLKQWWWRNTAFTGFLASPVLPNMLSYPTQDYLPGGGRAHPRLNASSHINHQSRNACQTDVATSQFMEISPWLRFSFPGHL